jgi:tripartite ATP-independent transporter DctM subunit
VPAMEKEGYPRDVAAAVVSAASIKGPIGPISLMFIVYGVVVDSVNINELLLSGILVIAILFAFQAATVYVEVRVRGFHQRRPFSGWRTVGSTFLDAVPILAIPVIILGGIFFGGVFTPTESAPVAAIFALFLAFFWYRGLSPLDVPRVFTMAALETGIVMLLLGDASILAKALQNNQFGQSVNNFFLDLTSNRYVFLLVVNGLLLLVGIFIEPLPAVLILAPFLSIVATQNYGIDPVHFGLIMCFNLVLALIHPPVGLVLFLVSSLSKVSVERLSITILPWLGVSIAVLFLVTYLPTKVVLVLARHSIPSEVLAALALTWVASWALMAALLWVSRERMDPTVRANWILGSFVFGPVTLLWYLVKSGIGNGRTPVGRTPA